MGHPFARLFNLGRCVVLSATTAAIDQEDMAAANRLDSSSANFRSAVALGPVATVDQETTKSYFPVKPVALRIG